MREIISDLEGKGNSAGNKALPFLPIDLLINLVNKEKFSEWGNRVRFVTEEIEPHLWSQGYFSEFFRMMSNLINNAAQASQHASTVYLSAKANRNMIEIKIRDEGCGIPLSILERINTVGGSFNKTGGSGFGLTHARQTAEIMGGRLLIESTVNVGTVVTVQIAKVDPPSWGRFKIQKSKFDTVVVVDDEAIFGDIWTEKIAGLGFKVLFYSHPAHIPENVLKDQRAFFIVDNNYDGELNLGLSFIEKIGSTRAALFTSDWSLAETQQRVQEIQTLLLEKDVFEWVQLEVL
jgi:anti-sigma regulatory factor (Ser/Thr protein kinase)